MHGIENIKNNHNDRTGINKTRIDSSFYTSPSKKTLHSPMWHTLTTQLSPQIMALSKLIVIEMQTIYYS